MKLRTRFSIAAGVVIALTTTSLAVAAVQPHDDPAAGVGAGAGTGTATGTGTGTGSAGLKVGVTHTQTTFFGDPAAPNAPASVKSAGQVLGSVGPLQAYPIMGWGLDNPEATPGQYAFEGLDDRLQLVKSTGGTPVITLCCSPDWMKGGKPGETDWSKLEVAPLPEHYDDFAKLSAEVAQRYPDVKYFQVWNEFKGFWNEAENRWNYEGYTELYNKVYTAVKKVRPDAKIGGPYTTTDIWRDDTWSQKRKIRVGDWGWLDDRNLDAIEYWNQHKVSADFLVVDGGSARNEDGYSPEDPVQAAEGFKALSGWLKTTVPDLPVWYAEFYIDGENVPASAYRTRFEAALKVMQESGVAVALMWMPECPGADDAEGPCLWSSTKDQANGGRATDYVPIVQQYAGLPE